MTTRHAAGLALLLCAAASGVQSAPLDLPLDPAHAAVGFRAYAFGVIAIDGAFTRFHGVLSIDPAAPRTCRVDVTVEVASLDMSDQAVRDDVLSPRLLDAAAFRTFQYSGMCRDDGIAGELTLHGVTRPLFLTATREGDRYSAQASLHRADWGITGRPLLAGPTIRIRVSTTLRLP